MSVALPSVRTPHRGRTRRGPARQVSLTYVWKHYSWWANRTHVAIPGDEADDV